MGSSVPSFAITGHMEKKISQHDDYLLHLSRYNVKWSCFGRDIAGKIKYVYNPSIQPSGLVKGWSRSTLLFRIL
jgi:hypothetical protein